jgi:hypothetical protein
MIYKTFEQWKSGNVLEHGVPRTEYYSEDQLDRVEMGWNYGYDAGRAVEQSLDKKAENAKELGLDYEPVLKDNSNYRYDPPVAEPVATLFGSLPVYDTTPPPQRQWVGLTDEEIFSVLDNLQRKYNGPPTEDSRVVFALAIEAKLKEKNT